MAETTNFIAYCIEEYKNAEKLSGAETIALFARHRIIPYLESCYEALHVLGPAALVADIRGIIFPAQSRAISYNLVQSRKAIHE